MESVRIDIRGHRPTPDASRWSLPQWGHPLSRGVFPLLLSYDGRIFPIGTAFTIGAGVHFMVSATHNVMEAFKHEQRLHRFLSNRDHLPSSIDLREVAFHLLFREPDASDRLRTYLWPIETAHMGSPTDVVFGFPQFQTSFPVLNQRISFDLPPIGEPIWSFGYSDFRFPEGGIAIQDINEGRFNWDRDYSHDFGVVEATVEYIFSQRFASGFVDGPCFTFSESIVAGQSGGPVMKHDGTICGINSASADTYFGRPASIASMLYPLAAVKLAAGFSWGPSFRFDTKVHLLQYVQQGKIATDGSESRLRIEHDSDTRELLISPRVPAVGRDRIFDDFAMLQASGNSAPSS